MEDTREKTPSPVPEGYHTVTPWVISRETAELIKFVTAAFGAEAGAWAGADSALAAGATGLSTGAASAGAAGDFWSGVVSSIRRSAVPGLPASRSATGSPEYRPPSRI